MKYFALPAVSSKKPTGGGDGVPDPIVMGELFLTTPTMIIFHTHNDNWGKLFLITPTMITIYYTPTMTTNCHGRTLSYYPTMITRTGWK